MDPRSRTRALDCGLPSRSAPGHLSADWSTSLSFRGLRSRLMTPPSSSTLRRQRLRFHSVSVETTPDSQCRVDVEVEWSPGTRIHGERVGTATREGMLITGSMATLEAIRTVTRGLLELDFRGAKLVRAFDTQIVIVAIRGRSPSHKYDLIGSTAAPGDDVVRGAVLSVLDATNRILELYAQLDLVPAEPSGRSS